MIMKESDCGNAAPVPPGGTGHLAQLPRLARIAGQVRGIAAMIEDGRYCIDLITQLQAARQALARVERDVLDAHMAACVESAMQSGDPELARAKAGELAELLRRSMK